VTEAYPKKMMGCSKMLVQQGQGGENDAGGTFQYSQHLPSGLLLFEGEWFHEDGKSYLMG
jgi:hypothetical protein